MHGVWSSCSLVYYELNICYLSRTLAVFKFAADVLVDLLGNRIFPESHAGQEQDYGRDKSSAVLYPLHCMGALGGCVGIEAGKLKYQSQYLGADT